MEKFSTVDLFYLILIFYSGIVILLAVYYKTKMDKEDNNVNSD